MDIHAALIQSTSTRQDLYQSKSQRRPGRKYWIRTRRDGKKHSRQLSWLCGTKYVHAVCIGSTIQRELHAATSQLAARSFSLWLWIRWQCPRGFKSPARGAFLCSILRPHHILAKCFTLPSPFDSLIPAIYSFPLSISLLTTRAHRAYTIVFALYHIPFLPSVCPSWAHVVSALSTSLFPRVFELFYLLLFSFLTLFFLRPSHSTLYVCIVLALCVPVPSRLTLAIPRNAYPQKTSYV